MTELDRILLDELQREYPNSAIRVMGGFHDGYAVDEDGPVFGSVPYSWDGSVITTDFRSSTTLKYKKLIEKEKNKTNTTRFQR